MSKYIILILILAGLFTACKKKNINPQSTWQIGDTTHTATHYQNNTGGAYIEASDGAYGLVVYFPTLPTVSGQYQVVGQHILDTVALASGEAAVEANVNAVQVYISKFSTSALNVTVSGSKINATITPIWCKHFYYDYLTNVYINMGDSLMVSGTIREY